MKGPPSGSGPHTTLRPTPSARRPLGRGDGLGYGVRGTCCTHCQSQATSVCTEARERDRGWRGRPPHHTLRATRGWTDRDTATMPTPGGAPCRGQAPKPCPKQDDHAGF